MISTNIARVLIYGVYDVSETEYFEIISTDCIVRVSASDKTYIGGEFSENGEMEVEFIMPNALSQLHDKSPLYGYHDVYMVLQFCKTAEDVKTKTYTTFSKRYYINGVTAGEINDNNHELDTVIYHGVDNIGILPDTELTYSSEYSISTLINDINKNVIQAKNQFGDKQLSIEVKITSEALAYISSMAKPDITFEGLNAREIIRQIAEAYNCVVYCRENVIYIDKYLKLSGSDPILNSDNIVKDSLEFDTDTIYTGISVDIYTGSEYEKGYEYGSAVNEYHITDNALIQNVTHAQRVAEYQLAIRPMNAYFIRLSCETHGFELTAPNSYDTMVTRINYSGINSLPVALASRQFEFKSKGASYTITAYEVGSAVYQSDLSGETS